MTDVLKTVTDRFCLYRNARTGRQNGRNYVLSAVRAMLESKETQEGLRLGEHFGYYGHGRREMTKKLDLPETSVIMVEGRPVVIDNVPACRTVSISVDDDGVVTHTQEILNTPPGKIVAAMIESRAGGWSWATGGRQAGNTAITTSFHGFDYVTNPNYVSLDHPASAGLFESADSQTLLAESLEGAGFSASAAGDIITHYGKLAELEMMIESTQRNAELEQMLLESQGRLLEAQTAEAALKERIALLESASGTRDDVMAGILARLDDLPIFVSRAQRDAFRFRNAHDAEIVGGLFESLMKVHARGLPVVNVADLAPASTPAAKTAPAAISFSGDKNPFAR
ncbi:head processing protein [Pantoea septica]|uniref:head processing protein n=1 Tax=Pantoea septica TaxID=472695 RepID=UPI0023F7BB1E|nr:head processing protein [Pantoea septica]